MLPLQEMIVLSLVIHSKVLTKAELIASTLENLRWDVGFTYGAAVDLINDLVRVKLIYPPQHGDAYCLSPEGRRRYLNSVAQYRDFTATFGNLANKLVDQPAMTHHG